MIFITKMENFKVIFPLIIFEHQYLAYYYICMHQLLHMFRKHSYLGKSVSDFLFKSSFSFYDKKRVTFVIFFLIFCKVSTSTYNKTKTKT